MQDLVKRWPEVAALLYVFAAIGLWSVLSEFFVSLFFYEKSASTDQSFERFFELFSLCIAAFIGSYFAFFLAKRDKVAENIKNEVLILNRALFLIVRQMNLIKLVQGDLDDYRDLSEYERAFNTPPCDIGDVSDMKQDFHALSFLIQKGYSSELFQLTLAQQNFDQTVRSINLRNSFMLGEAHYAIEQSGINGEMLLLQDIKQRLGERIYEMGINASKSMYEFVDGCLVCLAAAKDELRSVAGKIHPSENFVDFRLN